MTDPTSASHDAVATLIRGAGRREAPPEQASRQALAAMTQAWRAKVRRRQLRLGSALAAGVAALGLSAAIGLRSIVPPPPPFAPVASVERVIGAVQVRASGNEDWHSLQESDEPLVEGTALRTLPKSAAAVRIRDISVRIADGAELVIESTGRLHLLQGKVYIDTGGHGPAPGILVRTRIASVTDVGTQFEVRYDGSDFRVRIREGAVLLEQGGRRTRGSAGQQIVIDSSGAATHAEIAPADAQWRWTQALASPPAIDNQPLTVLLAWVARESGVPVRYASPDVERKATATILHGSIRRLEPLEALEVMLATTDLRHEVLSDGTILIK